MEVFDSCKKKVSVGIVARVSALPLKAMMPTFSTCTSLKHEIWEDTETASQVEVSAWAVKKAAVEGLHL